MFFNKIFVMIKQQEYFVQSTLLLFSKQPGVHV